MKKHLILLLSFQMITLSCGKENAKINTITSTDLIGKWKAVERILEFKSNGTGGIDTIFHEYAQYTFNSDNTFTSINGYFPSLPSDTGTYIFDEELQIISFKFAFDNPSQEVFFKNQKFTWESMSFNDNVLNVDLVTKNIKTNLSSVFKQKFVKVE